MATSAPALAGRKKVGTLMCPPKSTRRGRRGHVVRREKLPTIIPMTLDDRDRAITQLIAKFGQCTSANIFNLIFTTPSSRTSCDRALTRLLASNHIRRIERRAVGGSHGGSGQYVYNLGINGHNLYRSGRYIPARAINYHSLAIVEAFEALVMRSRAGQFEIAGYSTEPDCHITIERYELKPDLYIELRRLGAATKLWLEVDMGSQGQGQIKGKFERYWKAYNAVHGDEWPIWPKVLFVAVDAERASELQWLLGQGVAEAQELFEITTLDKLSTLML